MLSAKLLIPAWGGELDPDELGFIKSALKANRRLRAQWGMGRGHGRLSEARIREVAEDGIQSPSGDESEGDSDDGTFSEGGKV